MPDIDMGEYTDSMSINKIIGAPAGYIGYDDNKNINRLRITIEWQIGVKHFFLLSDVGKM